MSETQSPEDRKSSQANAQPSPLRVERITSPQASPSEVEWEQHPENSLRPLRFADYPGQHRAKANLQVYVQAARQRQKALDHVLLHGPPGLGKTTLARIIANELGVSFVQTSGPSVDKAGDLAGILAGLGEGAVLFIDEIHRLPIVVEEVLYSAMEDFCMDLVVGQGALARSMRMPIQPFTLIGATTRVSLLSRPLQDRFGIQEHMEFYSQEDLGTILMRSAQIEDVQLDPDAARALAARSRGTPRTANRLLRRVRDFSIVRNESTVCAERVQEALEAMDIDNLGLEPLDRMMLSTIFERYQGGPVGIETLAHTIGEDKTTLEDVYEPYLVHTGLIARGPRGREITSKAIQHLGLK